MSGFTWVYSVFPDGIVSALFNALRKRGWVVTERPSPVALLPDDLAARYPTVPSEVVDFLGRLETCHNADESVWFMTPDAFRVRGDEDAFHWNEYERMSLESEKGDAESAVRIRRFWDDHLPIVLAVHSDYDYLAVRVAEPNVGAVVHGFAPEWESPFEVARSLGAFLRAYEAEASSTKPEWPHNLFL